MLHGAPILYSYVLCEIRAKQTKSKQVYYFSASTAEARIVRGQCKYSAFFFIYAMKGYIKNKATQI
jgi:hypothetical protein